MPGLVDTHAHLDEIEDIDSALKQAEEAGVEAVIGVGQDLISNQKIVEPCCPLSRTCLCGCRPASLGAGKNG